MGVRGFDLPQRCQDEGIHGGYDGLRKKLGADDIAMASQRTLLCLIVTSLVALLLLRSRAGSTATAISTTATSILSASTDFYSLQGGEVITIRSLATNKYLTVSPSSGRVLASAESAERAASRWRVLVLDKDTVAALLQSARSIDSHSERFTGRKMATASGCRCSGFSNAHGLGRFCHSWEDPMQESWCYVGDNCSSATSSGSFGRRFESCEPKEDFGMDDEYMRQQQQMFEGAQPPASVLVPASGCNCSGFSSKLGFGGSCKGWEYEGQAPWCYVSSACREGAAAHAAGVAASRWARTDSGSYGHPFEECVWRTPDEQLADSGAVVRRLSVEEPTKLSVEQPTKLSVEEPTSDAPAEEAAAGRPPRRRLGPGRLSSLLASSPELERYVVLLSMHSHSFLHVHAPPHKEALMLTAKSDELSMRSIFSSFEHTRLILSLATNSLVNVCDEDSGEVCTGTRRGGEQAKLLRMPRRTARWAVERVG